MPLKKYQVEIEAGKLYKTNILGGVSGIGAQIAANIEVVGDTVTIYGSQLEPSSAPDGMSIGRDHFQGIESFGVIPNYMYIDGNPNVIILTGVEAVEVE